MIFCSFFVLLAPNIAFIKMAALAVIISDRRIKLARKRVSGQRFQLVSAWGDLYALLGVIQIVRSLKLGNF